MGVIMAAKMRGMTPGLQGRPDTGMLVHLELLAAYAFTQAEFASSRLLREGFQTGDIVCAALFIHGIHDTTDGRLTLSPCPVHTCLGSNFSSIALNSLDRRPPQA